MCLLSPIFLVLCLLVVKSIFVIFFFSCIMHVVPMKEVQLIVTMDDLDFGIRDITFQAKVFNTYGTFG